MVPFPRPFAALLGALLLAACAPEPRSAEPARGVAAESPVPREETTPRPARPAPRREPRPETPGVDWPDGWRLIESSGFGTMEDAVFWYRLEAPAGDPADAARRALEAVSPLVGAVENLHVGSVEQLPDQAVAQLRGERGRIGVDVHAEAGRLGLFVVLMPHTN
jgi:hypothetical protein